MELRKPVLEGLAAVAGLAIVAGESLETPAVADEVNCDDGQCDWPSQRRGSGVHFWERIQQAKYLGRMPGLQKVAAKLREPRNASVLMAEFAAPAPGPTQTPPPEDGALQANRNGGGRDPNERISGTRG
ncbi:MAG: hypothetical protein AAF609_05640 [Cyanobacteria bacterium P01_C01_bin.120]